MNSLAAGHVAAGDIRLRTAFIFCLLGAALALPLGLTLPLLSVDRLFLFSEEPSVIAVIGGLWRGGDVLLAAIVFAGSVLFPIAKLSVLHLAAAGIGGGLVRRLEALGRWSLLDVLLVALIVFSAKTSGVAAAASRPGLWFFAAAVLLAAAAGVLASRIRRSATAGADRA